MSAQEPQSDPRAQRCPKARKPLNRPALRGGVIQPGAHLTPGFYPAQKSNLWIALQLPSAMPFSEGPKGPLAGTETADPHNRPTAGQHRVSPPRWGWDAAQTPGGPQTPSNGLTRGKRFEGRSAWCRAALWLPVEGVHTVNAGAIL